MRALGDPLAASLTGATVIAGVEIAALGSLDPGLAGVAWVLLAVLGLVIAAVIAAQEAVVARLRLRGWPAALVRAVGALAPLALVAGSLFEGSRAANIPGAAYGHIWVPVAGAAAVAVAAYVGGRWLTGSRARRRVLIGSLVGLVVVFELANRRLFRSEYPDVHAFLIAASCVSLSLAIWLGAGPRADWTPRRALVWLGAVGTVVALLAVSLRGGLGDDEKRWRVATHGSHTRHLARIVRGVFDGDGDGFAAVLGGGDCDDANSAIHPGAAEILDNGVDEDCDGVDLSRPVEPPQARDRARVLSDWLASDGVTAILERTRSMNVLVIVVDALRADMLLSDAAADTMPRVRELAARSAVFTRAFAPAAGTDLSVSSIVTGRIDPFVILDMTLPESMKRSGRSTIAVLPSEVLRYAGKVLLGRGVDQVVRYVNDPEQRDVGGYTTTSEVTRRGLAALEARSRTQTPLYLWLHYFDVHEHLQIEATDTRLAKLAERFDLHTRAGKYAALAALTDAGIGQVLDALAEHRVADDTIIVLLSDHGESLAEDPRLPDNHGRFVYNALTHVPLIVHVPGLGARSVDTAVSIVDVAPTLTELAGVEPLPGADGTSLLPHLLEDAPDELHQWSRPIVLHESEQWGVIDWPLKLMVRPAENLTELYDLSVDFGEKRDLSAGREDAIRALKSLYATFPQPSLDRTRAGRKRRDELARPPSKK